MEKILSLSLGLASVFFSQIITILYFYFYKQTSYCKSKRIQNKIVNYSFTDETKKHLTQIEGLVMLGSYLSITWMYDIMPDSYYLSEGYVNMIHVLQQCLIVDFFQTVMHVLEHKGFYISRYIYITSHKPHHKFFNPILFNAFDGSIFDTFVMIIIPLMITAQMVHCNLWSYIMFGCIYSTSLTLIHSEYEHPWDYILEWFGIGTAKFHNIHHKLQKYNYGHMFIYWDYIMGTYKHN